MVKIKNVFGDEYKGKQRNMVYQKRYGRQIRRLREEHKENKAPGQVEQQRRFRVGLSWYKSLSYEEKQGLKLFLRERGINLTAQQYAIKTALDRGKVSKEVFEEQVKEWAYVEGWHAEGWLYRQKITLTNSNSYDLTDFQVKLELTAAVVGENFDWSRKGADLRFYDEAGNKLSYYVERWDEVNKTATVWVKVGLISANSTADIFMYYGNQNAESESDGEAVFEFFDSFEGTSLDTNKWTIISGTWQVEDGILHYINSGADSFVVGQFYAQWNTKQYVAEARIKEPDVSNAWGGVGIDSANDASAFYRAAIGEDGAYFRIQKKWTPYSDVAVSAEADHWYILRIWQDETTVYGEMREGEVGDNYYNLIVSNSLNDNSLSSGKVVLTGYKGDVYFDWVRVRKYAEQEPTTEFSSEEYGLTEGLATIQVEHVIIEHAGMSRVIILDENGEVIKEYTNLSDIVNAKIVTRLDWKNDTGRTVRKVIIESISGVLNTIKL